MGDARGGFALLFTLLACGGQSIGGPTDGAAGNAGPSGGSATAGSAATGLGGRAALVLGAGSNAGGGAGACSNGNACQKLCFSWSALANEPKPGAVGAAACPYYDDLEPLERNSCWWTIEQREPVPPDLPADGCCYLVSGFNCR
jgi:hypothetical protein